MNLPSMTPLRVLVAAATPSVVGGAEAWAAQVIRALAHRGHAIALLHERNEVPDRTPLAPTGTPMFDARAGLGGALAWRPDIVLVNGLHDPRIEAALVAARPAVLFAHSYYGTCATGTKHHAFPHSVPCTRVLGPACLLLHYPRRCGGLGPHTMLRDYRRQLARLAILPQYRRVLVASHHMAAEMGRHGIAPERLMILSPPPWDATPSPTPPPPPPANGAMLFLGRLTVLKGSGLLVPALRAASDTLGRPLALTLVGDGPAAGDVKRAAAAQDIPCTAYGWVAPGKRNAIIGRHELCLMPSLWPEPWGLAGLEAACQGVPTVAVASGGIPEWLHAGGNGELAPTPATSWGMAGAIVRALHDRTHYAALSRGAWEAAGRLSPEVHVTALIGALRAAAA